MNQAQTFPVPSVSLIQNRPATTSIDIAEHFGKRHDDVVKSIRNLSSNCPESFSARNFAGAEYTDEQGKPRPMFTVFFDGFILLVMGYTGKKALGMKLAYIEAFNAMREELEHRKEPVSNPDKLPSLSPAHRSELKGIVDAKLSTYPASIQGKARSEIWTRFNRHFRIAEYAQLPAERMAEARDYLIELEVKALKALPSATPALSPAPAFRTDFPADMHAGRKDALRKIQSLMAGVDAARDVVRLFCHPGGKSMSMTLDEREIYDALYQLYCAADDSLLAAYRALDAGYRIVRQYGRG